MLIFLYCLLGLDGPVGWYVYLVDYLGEVLLLCGVLLLLRLLDLAVLPIIMLQSRVELPAVLYVSISKLLRKPLVLVENRSRSYNG